MADAGVARPRVLHTGRIDPESRCLLFLLLETVFVGSRLSARDSGSLRRQARHLVADDVPDKANQLAGDRYTHQLDVLAGLAELTIAPAQPFLCPPGNRLGLR